MYYSVPIFTDTSCITNDTRYLILGSDGCEDIALKSTDFKCFYSDSCRYKTEDVYNMTILRASTIIHTPVNHGNWCFSTENAVLGFSSNTLYFYIDGLYIEGKCNIRTVSPVIFYTDGSPIPCIGTFERSRDFFGNSSNYCSRSKLEVLRRFV